MRKLLFASALVLSMFLLASCLEVESWWYVDAEGSVLTTVEVKPGDFVDDDEFSGYMQVIGFSVPLVFEVAEVTDSTVKESYSTKPVKTYRIKEPVHISSIEGATFTQDDDGVMKFTLVIPKVFTEKPSDPDEVAFTLHVLLPKEIDLANTTFISGNEATWKVTNEMLFKGTTLKAYTVE